MSYPCRIEGCGTVAQSAGGRTKHEKARHPEQYRALEVGDAPEASEVATRDDFAADEVEWVRHEEMGVGVNLGPGPASYSRPHVSVRFVADGLTRRVPAEEVAPVTEADVPKTDVLGWILGREAEPATDVAPEV